MVMQVAAGMKTDVTVEMYAIAAGVEGERGVGQISHNLEITTETDNLVIPVAANILSVCRRLNVRPADSSYISLNSTDAVSS